MLLSSYPPNPLLKPGVIGFTFFFFIKDPIYSLHTSQHSPPTPLDIYYIPGALAPNEMVSIYTNKGTIPKGVPVESYYYNKISY